MCAKSTDDENLRSSMTRLLNDQNLFNLEIIRPRTSVFDLLSKYPQIRMPFPTFLSLLMPLTIRQYSISSSPLNDMKTCTITYGVIDSSTSKEPAGKPYYGVATTYLSTLMPGDKVQVAVRSTSKQSFRLPLNGQSTPLLMFCVGTGIAPFRGFIQQRAIQMKAQKVNLAPAVLYVGCRSSTKDRLYAAEFDEYANQGVVELRYAFSQEPDLSEGCIHVSDRMLKDRDLIIDMWKKGARVYICGKQAFAQSVRQAAAKIVDDQLRSRIHGADGEAWTEDRCQEVREKFAEAIKERASSDVFD